MGMGSGSSGSAGGPISALHRDHLDGSPSHSHSPLSGLLSGVGRGGLAPEARQLLRMEISCETFVDLSSFLPELAGDGLSGCDADTAGLGSAPNVPRPPLACDAFIKALCVDSQVRDQFLLLV
jgi:hypothetical protein